MMKIHINGFSPDLIHYRLMLEVQSVLAVTISR